MRLQGGCGPLGPPGAALRRPVARQLPQHRTGRDNARRTQRARPAYAPTAAPLAPPPRPVPTCAGRFAPCPSGTAASLPARAAARLANHAIAFGQLSASRSGASFGLGSTWTCPTSRTASLQWASRRGAASRATATAPPALMISWSKGIPEDSAFGTFAARPGGPIRRIFSWGRLWRLASSTTTPPGWSRSKSSAGEWTSGWLLTRTTLPLCIARLAR